MSELKIMVEIQLDGPRMLQRPRPHDWDSWTDEARERFIDEMRQWLIETTVDFMISEALDA